MNFNILDFLEIGVSFDPNSNICTKVKNEDNLHGFVIDGNFTYLDNLVCSKTINKIYCQPGDLRNIFNIYNIIRIEYLKIKCNNFDYSLILSLINNDRPINIDKIQFEYFEKNQIYLDIVNLLLRNNYFLLENKKDCFFISRNKILDLICNPNLLDEIFIDNLKFNLDFSNVKL